jgi:RNA polymerase sigma factor (sigma-70 family)
MADDSELLCAYAETRSEAAFAELVRRHLDLVYSAVLRRVGGDTHLAEDVSQKVFVGLARQARSLRGRAVLAGWLYTASRFAAAEVVRGERRRRAREQEVFAMNERFGNLAAAPDPDWEQLRPVLDDAMDHLNERDREALLLRFFEGQALAEIGHQLDVTEEAARKRVDRALEKLRSLLAKKGVSSTAAAMGLLLASETVVAAPAGLAGAVNGSVLVSTSIGTTAAVVFFPFMSMPKIALGIVGVGLLLTVGFTTREIFALHAIEAGRLAVRRDYDALVSRQQEAEQRALAAEQTATELKQEIEEARAAQVTANVQLAAAAQVATPAAVVDPVTAGNIFMARHPEVKQALLDYATARADFRYSELFKALELTPEQTEEMRALFRNAGMGAEAANGTNLSLRAEAPTGVWGRRLPEMIGEERMQKFWELAMQSEARDTVVKVAGALYFTETPLSPQQSDEVVRLMVAHRSLQRGGNSKYEWDAIVAKAGDVLSAPQIEVLAGLRAQDQFNVALNTPVAPPTANPNSAPIK